MHTFVYGQDVLALDVWEGAPAVGALTLTGEGAAGSQGTDAWCWLAKDPASIQTQTGDGTPPRLVRDSSLRSPEALAAAAAALHSAAAAHAFGGVLTVPGAAHARPGTVVAVEGAPEDTWNGSFLVRRVRHVFDKRRGFTSEIAFTKTQEGGGGLLGALGGLL